MLSDEGHSVTQATVSRDLAALGALKSQGPSGETFYSLRDPHATHTSRSYATLRRHFLDFVTGIDASLNLTVIKTHPGAAPTVAAALDASHLDGVLGTLAGDDTVIVVNRDPNGGTEFAQTVTELLEG